MGWDGFQANYRQLTIRVRAQWRALTNDRERFEDEWDRVLEFLRARDATRSREERDGDEPPRG